MKRKILTLTTVYPSPAEPHLGIFVQSRLRHLAACAEVKVLAPVPVINYGRRLMQLRRSGPARIWDGTIEVIRPRWFYFPGAGAFNALFLFAWIVLPIARLKRDFDFQLLDAHFAHPEGVAAALAALVFRRPFTITMRGSEHLHARGPLRRRAMGWALRRAARVIAVSEKLRRLALELGVEPSRAVTIPNGVDMDIFHPYDRQAVRSEFGIAGGQRLIVSAGNLIELKGHHHIVRAVRKLADDGMDVVLLIAGGRGRAGDFEPVLRQQIASLRLEGRARLLGQVEQTALAKLISAADVFCLASAREGWPNVLHEALACGTPVVATAVGGVPEMIPSDEYGIVVPPGDQAALESALLRALAGPWDRERIAAWGQVRSWRQVAAEVLREMEGVCEAFTTAAN